MHHATDGSRCQKDEGGSRLETQPPHPPPGVHRSAGCCQLTEKQRANTGGHCGGTRARTRAGPPTTGTATSTSVRRDAVRGFTSGLPPPGTKVGIASAAIGFVFTRGYTTCTSAAHMGVRLGSRAKVKCRGGAGQQDHPRPKQPPPRFPTFAPMRASTLHTRKHLRFRFATVQLGKKTARLGVTARQKRATKREEAGGGGKRNRQQRSFVTGPAHGAVPLRRCPCDPPPPRATAARMFVPVYTT